MKLKHGKKYETADGLVFKVREYGDCTFDESDTSKLVWKSDGSGFGCASLIRRHYTKPQPAHKLDLQKGDVVELVKWEDRWVGGCRTAMTFSVGNIEIPSSNPKGQRPLFRVISRQVQPS